MEEYLSSTQLENIKNHSYKSTGYSKLDYKMNPFWEACAKYLPFALTPNMVTLIGVFCQMIGIIVILFYDNTMSIPLPHWVYILFAFLIFAAQTFDAIDGKHARNTKRSSPLGQLMDHGCDAFSNSFMIIMICQAHLFSSTKYTIIIQSCVQAAFYVFQWEENQTGTISTHIDNIGVTEFQFVGITVLLLPVFFGHSLSKINIFGLEIMAIIVYLNAAFGIRTILTLLFKNLKTVEDWKTKSYPMISMLLLVIAEFLTLKLQIIENYIIYVVILNGIIFGFMCSKLIICTMTKHKVEFLNWECVIYLLLTSVAYLSGSKYCEAIILGSFAIWVTFAYLKYMLSVINQLLNFLKINF